eukprot:SM000265S09778  [mRNA]  locus=s265:146696:148093:+ [translate_table: standard]
MTIVGFVVSGTFVLLVCLRIACMRMLRRRNQSAAAAAAAAAADPAASGGRAGRSSELHGLGRGGSQGLDPALIASFPMLKHGRDAAPATGKQDSQCVVCLGDYEEGDSLRRLPSGGDAAAQTGGNVRSSGPQGVDAEQLPWHYCRSFLALRRGGNSHGAQQPAATHLPPAAADTLPC